jgi:uncharacterized small protein (DUF1192 family)
MFDDDPFAPAKVKAASLAAELETASVEDLEKRIIALKEEILACEAAIGRKKAQRSAADSLFSGRS